MVEMVNVDHSQGFNRKGLSSCTFLVNFLVICSAPCVLGEKPAWRGWSRDGDVPQANIRRLRSTSRSLELDTSKSYPLCNVTEIFYLGNGICDGGDFNTMECGYDDGDCESFNSLYSDCDVENPFLLNNSVCDGGLYNANKCGWDGGDCDAFNSNYSNCTVEHPYRVGDGGCDASFASSYNTPQCKWDGGDCNLYNQYLNCTVPNTRLFGDTVCQSGSYNTEECGWDGGDCITFNQKYPNCTVQFPAWILDDRCYIFPEYNNEDCGWDGGACAKMPEDYVNAANRWVASNANSYSFIYEEFGEDVTFDEPIYVEVNEKDEVVRVDFKDSGSAVNPADYENFNFAMLTIRAMFLDVGTMLGQGEDVVELVYDDVYGFPTHTQFFESGTNVTITDFVEIQTSGLFN